jgi:CHAD domain-containing protein
VGEQVQEQDGPAAAGTGPEPAAEAGSAAPAPTGPQTVREVELKLRVHALFRLPELSGAIAGVSAVEREPTRVMTAVYHDTEDLRLFRWGVTLRRREGGPDEGWHMKLPVAGEGHSVRDEVRLPLTAGPVGTVPAELADIVTALAREEPLAPVATLRTERTPFLLLDADGEPVVELVDDTVSILDGEHVAARFREIEVELVGADPQTADGTILAGAVALLQEAGAVPGTASKAASALGPRASAPPDVVERGAVGPDDPASEAVRAHLARQVRRLLLEDVRVRRNLPDSVHQMRVAARRLRSGLKVFGPLLDAPWADDLRAELGWAASELGRVRDTEVLLARLDDHADELPPGDAQLATDAIERVLREELAQARTEALAALRSERHRALLVALVEAVHHPRFGEAAAQPCREVLPPSVAKAYRRLARDVAQLHIDSEAAPWHETRIAAKRARYAAEMVVPVFGDPAKRLAKALADVTEVLGDHQDCHVSQQTLRRIAARDDIDGATGFALGLLHAAEVEREMDLRYDFGAVWPGVQKVHRKAVLG